MEGASNGGMLYHEVQESNLCAVHCVNTVLQGPFFSEFDLAALASDLDSKDRQMMLEVAEAAQIDPELENAFICHLHDHWFCIQKVDGEWGNFPKECSISSSEASNGYGQWLSPEDAESITKSCIITQPPPQRNNMIRQHPEQLPSFSETNLQLLSDMEDEDLRAAIASSLMDSSPATASAEVSTPKTENRRKGKTA
ncbi:OTU domain-containing protein [Hibiscus syriacus]|uniref:ubiquitinyl hydrolase 1 n=1 Tax=Hibiscus syriacus TaxID=106335 RepID=A0A6A2ZGF9_HIBSY|nr:OTU domain-containing protein [Hibiscus syriacus]